MTPTYVFRCRNCGYDVETKTRDPAPECPNGDGACRGPMARDYRAEAAMQGTFKRHRTNRPV